MGKVIYPGSQHIGGSGARNYNLTFMSPALYRWTTRALIRQYEINMVVGPIQSVIIIIHLLRSRRSQGFSMHDDHQQMQQSAVLALLLHYPQAIFVHN